MKIMVLSQYFPPEVGATQTRMQTFASGLAARGHDVTVICELPNHPQGIVRPGYRRRAFVRRSEDGFRVLHVWVRATPSKTKRSRLAFYCSYMASAAAAGSIGPRPDVVFASSPPLFAAAAAAAIAKRHRVPWVMDVRDLWPAAALALGELADSRALVWAQRLERWLYRDAAAVSVVTDPFVEHVVALRGADAGEVHLIPNGTTLHWVAAAELEAERSSLELAEEEFLWVFAGNVGAAQGLETAIDAAELLGDGYRLLILGDGPARAGLERRAAMLQAGAVEFRDQVAPDMAARYLRAADCLLVSLSDHPVLASFVPSKLYDCCAVGRPVVLAVAGEAKRLALAHEAVLAVQPGDASQLAAAVERLASDPALAERLARAGRRFGEDNLRERHVERLAQLLEEVGLSAAKARLAPRKVKSG